MTTRTAASARPGGRPGRRERSYRCTECGWQAPRWVGRCPECSAWGSVEEVGAPVGRLRTTARAAAAPALPIGEVTLDATRTLPTGVDELDRVLGGGLVPGAVVLLAGEPGVGKSTLLLEVAARFAAGGGRALYVTGEESTGQVRLRAGRIGALQAQLMLAAETDLAAVLGHVDAVQPGLLVVDSVQTVASADVDSAAGSPSQVREVAAALIAVAKERDLPTILVGHVTKDGSIAGPRLLEHLVDVVLSFEGERHSRLRVVRASKNRHGPADEVGCFDLVDDGIVGLPDPTGLFLSRHAEPVPGTCVTVALEGRRPLLAEVQSLVVPEAAGRPTTSGLDSARVAMLLAVLERRGGVRLARSDVYAATVGGRRLVEPAADLAVALAVASAAVDVPLPADLVAVGEVGLAGEVRRVTGLSRRLAEAARLGFRQALVPAGADSGTDSGTSAGNTGGAGLRVLEVPDLSSALRAARSATASRALRTVPGR